MQCWIEKTISRVDYENGKGLIHRVTVTDVEGLSKTVGCERPTPFLTRGCTPKTALTGFYVPLLPKPLAPKLLRDVTGANPISTV